MIIPAWLNPGMALGVVLGLVGAAAGGFVLGDRYGTNNQKAADQTQFDRINTERASQTASANALYRAAQDRNVALMAERDKFKTELENHYADDQKATDAHRRELASVGLRYAGKSSGSRDCGSGTGSASGNSAAAPASAVYELPASITADLRQLTLDADNLADAYRLCYNYTIKVK